MSATSERSVGCSTQGVAVNSFLAWATGDETVIGKLLP
jgi:hypothetical protein